MERFTTTHIHTHNRYIIYSKKKSLHLHLMSVLGSLLTVFSWFQQYMPSHRHDRDSLRARFKSFHLITERISCFLMIKVVLCVHSWKHTRKKYTKILLCSKTINLLFKCHFFPWSIAVRVPRRRRQMATLNPVSTCIDISYFCHTSHFVHDWI